MKNTIETAGKIAVIKMINRKPLTANYARLERLKAIASDKAKRVLSNAQRELRRNDFLTSKKLDAEVNRKTWKLLTLDDEELRIASYENCASQSNGKEFSEGNKILND